MKLISIGAAAAVAAALLVAPAAAAQADQGAVCGWTGDVTTLMAKADRRVRSERVTEQVKARMGKDAKILSYKRMEVDLLARAGEKTSPTKASTLTNNRVAYNMQVKAGGEESTISAQVRFDGLCYRTTVVVDSAWVGSTGTDQALTVGADEALKLAQAYRKKHSADFPLDAPLVMMNLMQATTAPPDFGKLRWYVNYEPAPGALQILAVYMNGKVSPMS
ncbi:MAG: hypothetical protein ACKO70_11205 [Actinomycetota bacterium]